MNKIMSFELVFGVKSHSVMYLAVITCLSRVQLVFRRAKIVFFFFGFHGLTVCPIFLS